MIEFKIAETNTYSKKLAKPEYRGARTKISSYVYPQLRRNPFFGPNIKKLKGELEGVYRYRIGPLRLFYTVDQAKVIVFMVNLAKRKDAY